MQAERELCAMAVSTKNKTSNICGQHSNMHISAQIMAGYYSSYSKYAKRHSETQELGGNIELKKEHYQ